jgi:integrase
MPHIQRRTDRPGWVARYTEPNGRERSKSFRRKVDAERFLIGVEASKLRGEWVDPGLSKTTVRAFSERWRTTIEHLPASTRAGYETKLRVQVLPVFGDVSLGAVTGLDVREWLADMQKTLSRHTARQAKQVLGAILSLAVEEGYVARNVAAGVRLGKAPRQEQQFLTDLQVVALAEAIDPRYRTLVWFLAYSGLRWGEAAALKRIRVAKDRVRVVESLSEVGGAHFKETKTYSNRTVVLPAFVGTLLAEHMSHVVRPEPQALVFVAPGGGPLHSRNFRRRIWLPALEAAGLPKSVRIHDMRHTCAALMVSEGANPKQIQSHLGHSSITVTMDNYGHLFSGDVEALADRMDQRIRRVLA